jgi:plastocyanin
MPWSSHPRGPDRRWYAAAVGLFATACVAACSTPAAATIAPTGLPSPVPPAALATLAPPKPPPATTTGPSVGIDNFNFIPADLTVPAGTSVVWTNHDDVQHTVTASDNSFSSPAIDTEGQFSQTFSTPGTYAYFCAIHPFMTAKVIVQ